MASPTRIDPAALPASIDSYLAAHVARDTDTALRSFGADAAVVDEDRTYRGTAQIRAFLEHAGAEFHYTTELLGYERVDDEHWVVFNRIVGDFPGGVADLAYRFTMDGDDDITELVIDSWRAQPTASEASNRSINHSPATTGSYRAGSSTPVQTSSTSMRA